MRRLDELVVAAPPLDHERGKIELLKQLGEPVTQLVVQDLMRYAEGRRASRPSA
jgi:hypothetical protein